MIVEPSLFGIETEPLPFATLSNISPSHAYIFVVSQLESHSKMSSSVLTQPDEVSNTEQDDIMPKMSTKKTFDVLILSCSCPMLMSCGICYK